MSVNKTYPYFVGVAYSVAGRNLSPFTTPASQAAFLEGRRDYVRRKLEPVGLSAIHYVVNNRVVPRVCPFKDTALEKQWFAIANQVLKASKNYD